MADTSPPDDSPDSEALQACHCDLGGLMDLLSRRYAMQVVCAVGALGPVRYGDLEAAFGDVSSSTLSTRLRDLVDAGLLARTQYDEIPPRVEYELTEDGAELQSRLDPLLAWVAEQDDLTGVE